MTLVLSSRDDSSCLEQSARSALKRPGAPPGSGTMKARRAVPRRRSEKAPSVSETRGRMMMFGAARQTGENPRARGEKTTW
jgi:hypothetical protein